jgi:hypothetical protein
VVREHFGFLCAEVRKLHRVRQCVIASGQFFQERIALLVELGNDVTKACPIEGNCEFCLRAQGKSDADGAFLTLFFDDDFVVAVELRETVQ